MKYHRMSCQLVKFLTYVLGRRPDEFGLVPDSEGFIPLFRLLKAVCEDEAWRFVRESHIHEILMTAPDIPFEISGNRIRATDRSQLPEHIVVTDVPKLLYGCVRRKAWAHVLAKGLSPAGDPWVVLSSDREMALRMGKRNDPRPVLLTVLSQRSVEQGVVFHRVGVHLFTAGHIPAGCFTGPALHQEKEPAHTAAPPPPKPTSPGSFILDVDKGGRVAPKGKGQKKEILWKKERKHRRDPKNYLG